MKIITDYPIATTSPDHITPFGIALNNSSNINFNKQLYKLFNHSPLRILDLGCAGGGFIKTCVDDGHTAIGIDGSDYAKINNLGEWDNIPNNLFTTDISKSFQIVDDNNNIILFDVITLWDVLEHILEEDLSILIENLDRHLSPAGCIICSINIASKEHADYIFKKGDWGPGKHHQNIQDIEYWDNFFESNGFINNRSKLNSFNGEFIRGPGHCCNDYATEERFLLPNLPLDQQWATLLRFYERST